MSESRGHVLKRQALFVLLAEDAKRRQTQADRQATYQRIADEVDSPELARRMRAVAQAQAELDSFVLAEVYPHRSR